MEPKGIAIILKRFLFILTMIFVLTRLNAQNPTILTLDLDKPGRPVSPALYGLMTEEINYSYDGGLYAEQIRNRNFRDNADSPRFWKLIKAPEDKFSMSLDRTKPVNSALPVSLKVEVKNSGHSVRVENVGYWGIAVKPSTTYQGSFYARRSVGTAQTLSVSLEDTNGQIIYASAEVSGIDTGWKQFHFTLTTKNDIAPTKDARFVITAADGTEGTYWFSLVSLFPPTFHDRPNGNRSDIMELLADMKPAFLRFPGGNYLEGNDFANRWDWKKTIGPIEKRSGHFSPWRYRSTDGMGLLEFLEWCEDLKMDPLLAVFAGFVLNKDYMEAGPFLKPFVDDVLDEIEYVTGDSLSKWGSQRARDGHPRPFKLRYIEIGNEDFGDYSGLYHNRYVQFYDAIKSRYPNLQIISTVGGKNPENNGIPSPPTDKMDVVDEHYYRSALEMEEMAYQFDNYDRRNPKVFVGEWATVEGTPTPNFNAALGDAAWITGMEKNADIIIMSCYAPLLANVNPGGIQWETNLIGYNGLTSYGSPSYYVQKMFSNHIGNKIIPATTENIPFFMQTLSMKDSVNGIVEPKKINTIFYSATRDTVSGRIYLKLVNTQNKAQDINIQIKGAGKISRAGKSWALKANDPLETNSITDPQKIIPVEISLKNVAKDFRQILPAYSITVMELECF